MKSLSKIQRVGVKRVLEMQRWLAFPSTDDLIFAKWHYDQLSCHNMVYVRAPAEIKDKMRKPVNIDHKFITTHCDEMYANNLPFIISLNLLLCSELSDRSSKQYHQLYYLIWIYLNNRVCGKQNLGWLQKRISWLYGWPKSWIYWIDGSSHRWLRKSGSVSSESDLLRIEQDLF